MTNNFGSTSTGQKPTTPQQQQATLIDDLLSPVFKSSPIPKEQTTVPNYVGDIVQEFIKCFKGPMSSRLKLQVMDYMFKSTIVDFGGMDFLNYVCPDFLNICFSAMETLHKENKNNLILELCKCFERTGCKSQSRMPLDRMPLAFLITTFGFLHQIEQINWGMKNIMLHGLIQCSPSLVTNGCAFIEAQHGNMKWKIMLSKLLTETVQSHLWKKHLSKVVST